MPDVKSTYVSIMPYHYRALCPPYLGVTQGIRTFLSMSVSTSAKNCLAALRDKSFLYQVWPGSVYTFNRRTQVATARLDSYLAESCVLTSSFLVRSLHVHISYKSMAGLQCVCGDVFTASCDVEPSGCAFAWLLLLLSVVAHAMRCCKTDDARIPWA